MNQLERKYAKAVQKMIFFESGLAVAELPQSKLDVLQDSAHKEYEARLAMFDPTCDDVKTFFSGHSFSFTVRDTVIEEFKNEIASNKTTGKKIWQGYVYIKSEIMNHWLPHFEMKSGESLDDAIERVRMHVWAYRANRTIIKNNKKLLASGETNTEDEKIWTDAPEGSIGNIMLELPILKRYHDHPFLKINIRNNGDEEEINLQSSDNSPYNSVVSSLKSHKEQRKANIKRMKVGAKEEKTYYLIYKQMQHSNKFVMKKLRT